MWPRTRGVTRFRAPAADLESTPRPTHCTASLPPQTRGGQLGRGAAGLPHGRAARGAPGGGTGASPHPSCPGGCPQATRVLAGASRRSRSASCHPGCPRPSGGRSAHRAWAARALGCSAGAHGSWATSRQVHGACAPAVPAALSPSPQGRNRAGP